VEIHGDHGEVEAFRKSWCWYDWAVTRAMVDAGVQSLYERPHTLSKGDDACDIRWSATPPG
jgi:hypothetical protein